VAGPDGNLWFTNTANDSIGRITPSGVVTRFTDPDGTIDGPWAIAVGSDGNLWFTNALNDSIGQITTSGDVANFTDTTVRRPHGIAAGPDGNLWFTNSSGFSIGRITTAGVISRFTDPNDFIDTPEGIAAGPDGNLWFTDRTSDAVARITTTGAVTYFASALIHAPASIAAGPDGNLWFTNGADGIVDGSIGRITTGGSISNFVDPNDTIAFPRGIASGPDGNLWFANSTGSIGRITPAGAVASFTDPDGPIGPHQLAAGPDGNMWFTNLADSIGYVGTGATPVTRRLTVTTTGSGTVSSTPTGIACGPTCTSAFAVGSEIALRAHPSEGAAFVGWSGGCSGTGVCEIDLTSDTTVAATFTTGIGANLSIGDGTVVEGASKARSLRFAVTLSEPVAADVTASYFTVGTGSATPDVDYTSRSGRVTIPAGHVSGTLSVPVRGDAVVEGKESFLVVLSGVEGARLGRGVGTGRIVDDDPTAALRVAVGDASIVEGFRGTRTLRFTISASTDVDTPVSVAYTTVDGSALGGTDFGAAAGRAEIAAGTSSVSVSVLIAPDRLAESTEKFTVRVSDPTDALVTRATGVGTILDDDAS
jgi:streptogramin lyase